MKKWVYNNCIIIIIIITIIIIIITIIIIIAIIRSGMIMIKLSIILNVNSFLYIRYATYLPLNNYLRITIASQMLLLIHSSHKHIQDYE